MLEGFRIDDLIRLLAQVREDGTGLSVSESAKFLNLATDPEVFPRLNPFVAGRVLVLRPLVQRRLERIVPTIG